MTTQLSKYLHACLRRTAQHNEPDSGTWRYQRPTVGSMYVQYYTKRRGSFFPHPVYPLDGHRSKRPIYTTSSRVWKETNTINPPIPYSPPAASSSVLSNNTSATAPLPT